jgi:hypothetical protein
MLRWEKASVLLSAWLGALLEGRAQEAPRSSSSSSHHSSRAGYRRVQ